MRKHKFPPAPARGGTRHGAGRPPVPVAERRDAVLYVRLTAEEKAALARRAGGMGISISKLAWLILTK